MCARVWTKSPERVVVDDALRTKQVLTPTGAGASKLLVKFVPEGYWQRP